ncbi:MAG: 16S rRNA (adenine(1518)-N(6)/adenine(1519)-N(6))-dimethyltransferase RsmA [Chloroflexota bacterium]|nr:16S rRNA (adenine(1518)-N(6)/adenine(1519)-N(6))-dimethyltransferase RsmA [Chloroflexota bacterium]
MPPAARDEADPLDATHLGAESLRRYLRRHSLVARRAFSQNFLVDGEVLEAIVQAADPGPGRRILEVGPGVGILTGALLRAGAALTAVEIDRDLAAHLRTRFQRPIALAEREPGAPGALQLVEADVLDTAIASLVTAPYDLVANLPYHITSPVLHHVLGTGSPPQRLVLMLQREVAERIASRPGGMSYLSVFVQYHAEVQVLRVVPAAAFEPPPEVESAILVGTTRPARLGAEAEEDLWRLVQAGFRERRKMLHNVLPRQLPSVGRERFGPALAAAGIAADRRPQTLSVEEWLTLAQQLGPLDRRAA